MSALLKTFAAPPVDEREIARYAGCRASNRQIEEKIRACLAQVQDTLKYTVVYREYPVTLADGIADFGDFRIVSQSLCRTLAGCDRAVLFAATVGLAIDRLIARYSVTEPSKALLLQSIGAERIEALCDCFCDFLAEQAARRGKVLRPRFSPGYGDCPLTAQRDIFTQLDCGRSIGLSLTQTLMMSPSKSVTAIVGLGR